MSAVVNLKNPNNVDDKLCIAGVSYQSRLLVGTGKYKDFAESKAAIEASEIGRAHV